MPYWSVQIKDILTEAGLFDIVSGVAPRPALQTDKGDNSVAVNSWDAKDKRALANIRTRVSSTMISYVINAMTSKQAWDSLKAVFDVQGPVAVILKRRRFFWYAIPEGADIEEHVHALRTCSEKLSLLQDPISDRDFTLVLLTALPESWDSFVATIDVNTTKSVDLTGRILQEDARRQSQSGTHAFPAFQRHPPGNGPTGPPGQTPHCFDRSTVTCHRCGKKGHIAPECRSRPRGKHQKKSGHKSYPAKVSNHPNSVPSQPTNPDQSNSFTFVTFLSEHSSKKKPELFETYKWLGDTGSQSHICVGRSLFETYTPTPGKTLYGIGTTPILGIGTVRIKFYTDQRQTLITLTDVLHVPSLPHHLISLGRLTDNTGLWYMGVDESLGIYDTASDTNIGEGYKIDNLYELLVMDVAPPQPQSFRPVPLVPGTIGTFPSAI